MCDEPSSVSWQRPTGRFQRLWMEFEIEIVDESALRSFAAQAAEETGDPVTGVTDGEITEQVSIALRALTTHMWRAAENTSGLRWVCGQGPSVRVLDDTGWYAEMTLSQTRHRGEDGRFDSTVSERSAVAEHG